MLQTTNFTSRTQENEETKMNRISRSRWILQDNWEEDN